MIPKLKNSRIHIVFGVYPIIFDLDEIIAHYAPEWPLDQVASIDRNIIRIAFWEFAVENCTPVKVAINEAVELGKDIRFRQHPQVREWSFGKPGIKI